MTKQTVSIWALPVVALGVFYWQIHGYWDPESHYFYGWGVPFLTLYLVYILSFTEPEGYGREPAWLFLATGLTVVVGIVTLMLGSMPDWIPLNWLLGLGVVGFVFAWLAGWRGVRYASHYWFPLLFSLVAIPWPAQIENWVSTALTGLIATFVTQSLQLLGIPAILEGIQISIGSTVVEVAEACSGIRSLQFLLVTALFLGAYGFLSPRRRIALMICAAGAALLQNAIRALVLGWVTGIEGREAYDQWHDPTGAVTFAFGLAILIGFYLLIETPIPAKPPADAGAATDRPPRFALALTAILLIPWLSFGPLTRAWYYNEINDPEYVWMLNEQALRNLPSHQELPIHPSVYHLLDTEYAVSGRFYFEGSEVIYNYIGWPEGTSILKANQHNPSICMGVYGGLDQRGEREVAWLENDLEGLSYEIYEFDRTLTGDHIVALRTLFVPIDTREFYSFINVAGMSFREKLGYCWNNMLNRETDDQLLVRQLVLLGINNPAGREVDPAPLIAFIDQALKQVKPAEFKEIEPTKES